MEIITNPLFWGEVGLAAASKLALLAAVLWVARIAVSAQSGTPRHAPPTAPSIGMTSSAGPYAGVVNRAGSPGRELTPGMHINLRRPPEPAVGAGSPRDHLRERLLEYIEARSAGRNRP